MSAAAALNVEELRRLASRRLPRMVREFIEGGAEDHLTLRANRAAFEALRFVPRTLVDVSRRSLATTLLGMRFDAPFGIAPVGAPGLCWRGAEVALARAARSLSLPFALSTHSFVPLERVAYESGGAPWFQLYMPNDRAEAQRAVDRALQAGSAVLVLTTDVPVGGNREYNLRNGFGMPPRLGWRTLLDGLAHPRWLAGVYFRNRWRDAISGWGTRRDALDWEGLAWLRAAWPGKLLVKGVLSAQDARRAAEHGVDGIYVSNHGGRQLDGAPSPLEVLPAIAAAVGRRLPILLDGGVRRGADIAKALALGADMVLVGRAALYGVAAGGEAGARRALQILHAELDRVLALLGCTSPGELGREHLLLDHARPQPLLLDTDLRRAAAAG